MASPICGKIIDLDLLHFTPDELRSLNELVVTAVLKAPEMAQFHTFWTGIKNDKRIGIIPGTFGLVGKAAQGCNPDPDCITVAAIEKTWEPKYIEIIVDQCVDELMDSLMRFALKCGIELYDLTKTDIFAFILNILEVDIKNMIFRHAWFGDQNAANVNAGGVITNGVDVAYFNIINGFFQQLAVIYAATPARLTAIAGNNQLTYALQGTVLTNALAYANVNAVIDAALPELKAQPDRLLLVTNSIMIRLRRQLQALGVAFKTELMINGIEFGTWDGIPIYSLPLWDQWIMAYEDDGTRYNNPHRVVYTTKSNLNIGTPCTGLFDNINSFYDQRSRVNRIEAVDAFDVKIFDDRLVQVGI
jgi:hypothetical protein